MPLTDEEKQKIEEEERYRALARIRAEQSATVVPKGPPSASKNDNSGCIWIFCVLTAVWLLFMLVIAHYHPSAQTTEADLEKAKADKEWENCHNNTAGAMVEAERHVRDKLKAPATAEFPWLLNTKSIGDCSYDIHSYVDSQNSFGAKIRTRFHVVIHYAGNDIWVPLKIDFES